MFSKGLARPARIRAIEYGGHKCATNTHTQVVTQTAQMEKRGSMLFRHCRKGSSTGAMTSIDGVLSLSSRRPRKKKEERVQPQIIVCLRLYPISLSHPHCSRRRINRRRILNLLRVTAAIFGQEKSFPVDIYRLRGCTIQ